MKTIGLVKEYERADLYFEKFYGLTPEKGTGYRADGVISYIYNLLSLQKYERGFQVIEQENKNLDKYADYHFACGMFYTQAILGDIKRYISYLPQIENSYLKCLEIGEVPENGGVLGSGSFKAAYNLGVWFEVSGNKEKALQYYRLSADENYRPAIERMEKLLNA